MSDFFNKNTKFYLDFSSFLPFYLTLFLYKAARSCNTFSRTRHA